MYHNFFVHSSVDGHLGCFHVLAIINSVAMNIGVHVSFSILVSSEYMPGTGIVGSYVGFIPSFLRTLHTVFHSGCISLLSHQQCKKIPFFPHPFNEVDKPRAYLQSKVSQKEKYKYRILTHIYGIYKDGTDEFICRVVMEIQT